MSGDVTFDRDSFFTKLAAVRDKCAELYLIDKQLDWLRGRDDVTKQGILSVDGPGNRDINLGSGTVFRFTLGSMDDYQFEYVVLQKESNPVTDLGRSINVSDDLWDEAMRAWADFARTGASLASQQHAEWTSMVTLRISVDHEDFASALDQMKAAHVALLEFGQADVARLRPFGGQERGDAGPWWGDAADSFTSNFYDDYDIVRANQAWALASCAEIFSGVMTLNDATQGALMSAVEAADTAVTDQLEKRKQLDESASEAKAYQTLSELLGLGSVLSAATPPLAATFAALATGASLRAGTIGPGQGVYGGVSVKGASASEITSSLTEAFQANLDTADDVDDDLTRQLGDVRRHVNVLETDAFLFRSPAPFVDGAGPGTFAHDSA